MSKLPVSWMLSLPGGSTVPVLKWPVMLSSHSYPWSSIPSSVPLLHVPDGRATAGIQERMGTSPQTPEESALPTLLCPMKLPAGRMSILYLEHHLLLTIVSFKMEGIF